MKFMILRIFQQFAIFLAKIYSFFFKIPAPPDVLNIPKKEVENYYFSIAQKRLPNISIDKVIILGFFVYSEEKLDNFKDLFKNQQVDKFVFNKDGFDPYRDYACVLKITSKNDVYTLIEVQYYDFRKKEEIVFLEKEIFNSEQHS